MRAAERSSGKHGKMWARKIGGCLDRGKGLKPQFELAVVAQHTHAISRRGGWEARSKPYKGSEYLSAQHLLVSYLEALTSKHSTYFLTDLATNKRGEQASQP